MRALGVGRSVRKPVRIRKRRRTHDEASLVEAFVLLMAVGGDCFDDFNLLREDKALCRLLGRPLPSPETARKFLYELHDNRGTCYRAANWTYLGMTTGRGKADQTRRANRPLKQVFGYPLVRDFQRRLRGDA